MGESLVGLGIKYRWVIFVYGPFGTREKLEQGESRVVDIMMLMIVLAREASL